MPPSLLRLKINSRETSKRTKQTRMQEHDGYVTSMCRNHTHTQSGVDVAVRLPVLPNLRNCIISAF